MPNDVVIFFGGLLVCLGIPVIVWRIARKRGWRHRDVVVSFVFGCELVLGGLVLFVLEPRWLPLYYVVFGAGMVYFARTRWDDARPLDAEESR